MDRVGRIGWKRFEKFLLEIGCEFVSQEGSHRKYKKAGLLRPIIIPMTGDLTTFVVLNNLRTLGVSKKVFVEMISRL